VRDNWKEPKMKLKRSLATGAAVVIAGLSLVACGSDDDGGGGGGGGDAGDSPDSASTEDFCGVFTDVTSDLSGGGSADEQADAAHEVADKFNDVGTPEDMPEDARNGFEVFIGFLGDVDADDIEKFSETDPSDDQAFAEALGIDEADVADVTAFFTYAATACVGDLSQLPTDPPS
jgi:hypothetical protein